MSEINYLVPYPLFIALDWMCAAFVECKVDAEALDILFDLATNQDYHSGIENGTEKIYFHSEESNNKKFVFTVESDKSSVEVTITLDQPWSPVKGKSAGKPRLQDRYFVDSQTYH